LLFIVGGSFIFCQREKALVFYTGKSDKMFGSNKNSAAGLKLKHTALKIFKIN